MPGDKRLLRVPTTAQHTAGVLLHTTRVVFLERGPRPHLVADFSTVIALHSLQQLRQVCFQFDDEDDVEGVAAMLTLLGNRCPLLNFVGAARVGSQEPARLQLRFVSVEQHLGCVTSDAMRSVDTTQQPATQMAAMLSSLAGIAALGGLQSLHLTDGFTFGDAGGVVGRTNTYDKRASASLPALPAAVYSNLTALQLSTCAAALQCCRQLSLQHCRTCASWSLAVRRTCPWDCSRG